MLSMQVERRDSLFSVSPSTDSAPYASDCGDLWSSYSNPPSFSTIKENPSSFHLGSFHNPTTAIFTAPEGAMAASVGKMAGSGGKFIDFRQADQSYDLQSLDINGAIDTVGPTMASITTFNGLSKAAAFIDRKRKWISSLLDDGVEAVHPSTTYIHTDSSDVLSDELGIHEAFSRQNTKNTYECPRTTPSLTGSSIPNGAGGLPPGWEQYLNLETGESYFVNWNTRTKHCRIDCPEVQRCLADSRQHQEYGKSASKTCTNRVDATTEIHRNHNTEAADLWLSKMSAITSAIMNRKSTVASKRPPIRSSLCKTSKTRSIFPTAGLENNRKNAMAIIATGMISNPTDLMNGSLNIPVPTNTDTIISA
ncbi:hypothetical protein KP509_10G032300 [Ceratopteris richardii]|uniref:WW domain-containing protein n=1 Tax=Ceratopteris richardii TaxID=49495 RepID=A0A8T2TY13_CERRI|nr:hypothetical protein KP509_10G032300 [Ceratopteris richardii]